MNLVNQPAWKIKDLQVYTYGTDAITVTGTDGSATAKIHPNWTIVVEAVAMNTSKTITLDTPFPFKIIGMKVINTGGASERGTDSVQLKNGTSAITDAVDQGGLVGYDFYDVREAYIDDAHDTFAAGNDDLVLTFAANPASTASTNTCRVIIYIQPE